MVGNVALKTTASEMIAAAEKEIRTVTLDEAKGLLDDPAHIFVDIRDVRELDREGMIPGSFHSPRGMLEFWVDPTCKYHHKIFAEDATFVFYCASAWRSALSTKALQDMGMKNICHLDGGFSAWKKAGHPVGDRDTRRRE